jgi:hypothetical protein
LDQVTDSELRRVLAAIQELRAVNGQAHAPVTPAQLISRLSDEAGSRLIAELVEDTQKEGSSKDEAFAKCLQRLRQQALERRQRHLQSQLGVAQASGHDEETRRLLIELHETSRSKSKMASR